MVWHWSQIDSYPPDEALERWSRYGTILLLQSEVMLWKDWNLGFEPRRGSDEFARVRDTLHRLGMRMLVYTSPHYFLRGTDREATAMNSFENFSGWPAGTHYGENIELFLAAIARLLKEHRPDGLYFDGQYTYNPAGLYLLARKARELLGEEGLLEWHSTYALGMEQCYLPPADAYVDIILRGEGAHALYEDERYLRYFVSGYNAHNCIGVLCCNTSRPTPKLIDRLLSVNGRMHTMAGWMGQPIMDMFEKHYLSRLGPSLHDKVSAGVEERQLSVRQQFAARAEEYRRLIEPPQWSSPLLEEGFEDLDGWQPVTSSKNPDPFACREDMLQITASAHTYAWLQKPLDQSVQGLVVKMQPGNDQGQSWGPAVCLRWSDDYWLRLGLRSDGLVQTDLAGDQRIAPGHFDLNAWTWLRLRWGPKRGAIEMSTDGRDWRRLWMFDHGGKATRPPQVLLIGKIPFNGQPIDHVEAGPVGTSLYSQLYVY